MSIDLKNLNNQQLNELIAQARMRQHELVRENLGALRDRLEKIIKQEGYTLDEVFPGRGRRARKSGGIVPAKYANPANAAQTWTGRGKRPRWFNDALAAGKKESDLLIKS